MFAMVHFAHGLGSIAHCFVGELQPSLHGFFLTNSHIRLHWWGA